MVAFTFTRTLPVGEVDTAVAQARQLTTNLEQAGEGFPGQAQSFLNQNQAASKQLEMLRAGGAISQAEYDDRQQTVADSSRRIQNYIDNTNANNAASNTQAANQSAEVAVGAPLADARKISSQEIANLQNQPAETPAPLPIQTNSDGSLRRPWEPDPDQEADGSQSVAPASSRAGGERIVSRPNPLNVLLNYSYGISLHYMTMRQYNDVCVLGATYSSSNQNVIAASGGRNSETLSRHPYFKKDIYIDSMKMITVTSHNSQTRGSNAVDIEFTIIEPVGMTFIQSLIKLAVNIGVKTWDNLPLVLQVDFFGQDNDGDYIGPAVEDLAKFICVKIIDLKIHVTNKGSEYRIRAVPQSHLAFFQNVGSVPINLEIYSQTIAEFFDNSRSSTVVLSEDEERDREGSSNPNPQSFAAYSFASALNKHQLDLKQRGYQGQADEYKFVIDSDIASSKIFEKKYHNIVNAALKNKETKSDTPTFDRGLFPVNAGTSVKEVINQIMKSSEYYSRIFSNVGSNEMESQNEVYTGKDSIETHLIRTTVEYDAGAWDEVRNHYKRIFTFYIEKYQYHNTKDPEAKMSVPSKNTVDKVYEYLYTGQNTEILNCKIDFNTMFFVALTAFESKTKVDNIQQNKSQERSFLKMRTKPNAFMPLRIQPIPAQAKSQQNTDGKKRSVEVNDFFNIMYSSQGDMLSIDLEIMGDPDLIKQDDVFYPPKKGSGSSLPMDRGQIFANLNFRLPDDIDLESGNYIFSDEVNYFSGTYDIIKVDNMFANGRFSQTLKLVRVFENVQVEGTNTTGSTAYEQRQETVNSPGQPPAMSNQSSSPVGAVQAQVREIDNALLTVGATQAQVRAIDNAISINAGPQVTGARSDTGAAPTSNPMSNPADVLQSVFSGRVGRAGQSQVGQVLKNLPVTEASQISDYPSP